MDFDPNKPPIYYRSLRRRRARSSRIAYPILFVLIVIASLAIIAFNLPARPAQSMTLIEGLIPTATESGGLVIPTLTASPIPLASATVPPPPLLPSLTPTPTTLFQSDPRAAYAHCGKTVIYGTVSEGIYGVNNVWVRVWWPDGSLPQNWQAATGSNALWGNGGYEVVLSELPIAGTWFVSVVDGDGKPIGDILPVTTTATGCEDGTGKQIINVNFTRQRGSLGELALLPTPTPIVQPTVAPPPVAATIAPPPPVQDVANPLPPLVSDGTGRRVRVPILMYHYLSVPPPGSDAIRQGLSVGPDVFRAQLITLREHGYTSISMTDLAYAIDMGTPLPPKPVVITFDDGYRDNYENAFPILKEEGFTATFFVFTNVIEERNTTYMTWEMLVEMQQAGMEIGSHTLSHLDLSGRTEARIRQELSNSRELLQQRLGVEIRTLAYPYGGYDSGVAELARQSGYWIAVTTKGGTIHGQNDIMTATRVRVQGGMFPGRLLDAMADCSVYKEC